jgi:hypothetical protein
VGGIPCADDRDLEAFKTRLETNIQGQRCFLCQVDEQPSFQVDVKGTPIWNQAAVLFVKHSDPLEHLVQQCVKAVEPLQKFKSYALPLGKSHISLYYETNNVPNAQEIQVIDSFTASCVEIWCTTPSCTEGVEDWKVLHSIPLLQ